MKFQLLVLFLSFAAPFSVARRGDGAACAGPSTSSLPFCNVSLALELRLADLVSRMNLSEKISQIVRTASSIPRLGIPSYEWWEEALHGVAESPGVNFSGAAPAATSFPQVILTAASFNSSLWTKIAQAISTEAVAMYNSGNAGLTFWSPNINIFRDPRWGRGQETPGEDPLLSGKYATYFVRGMQEGNYEENTSNSAQKQAKVSKLKVSSCCKHFTAYDMEKSEGTDRFHFDAQVTEQDLQDTFNPPFRSCVVDGRASGVMCSYNRVNGVPSCADHRFLTETIREAWGFEGYIVSDCDAVALLYECINYTKTGGEAAADVLLAGMDLNCGTFMLRHTTEAIQQGLVTEASIDRALSNVMAIRMRLGLFDGDSAESYSNLGPDSICTEEHRQLSLEAAQQGIVLLKNQGNILPLEKDHCSRIAVIGPHGNATEAMLGNYAGVPCEYITPIQALQDYGETVVFQPGCSDIACNSTSLFSSATKAAEEADAVVVVVGLDKDQEREGLDRTSLLLPGFQQELVKQVSKASKGPVILVVMSGGPIDLSFAKDDSKISSILWVGYPGEAGGKAISRVIFGEYNPAGRLTVTWYPQEFLSKASMLDMHMRPNSSSGFPGRTYRFYTGETVYPFGYGLSYTNFTYSALSSPATLMVQDSSIRTPLGGGRPEQLEHLSVDHADCEHLDFKVVVEVRNSGPRDGDHVLLLFARPPSTTSSSLSPPVKQLISFKKLHLEAGGVSERVEFGLNACRDLSLVDTAGKRVLAQGEHLLSLGEDLQHSVTVQLFM